MTTPVDLLAVGPHPDDIEIGIGGLVAKHASLGHTVALCDLTGTVRLLGCRQMRC